MVRCWTAAMLALALLACRSGGASRQSFHSSQSDKQAVAIDVTVRGGGRVITVNGSWCSGRCRIPVVKGTTLTLWAESNTDFFAGWSAPCGAEPVCTFTASRDLELEVQFAPDRYRFEWLDGKTGREERVYSTAEPMTNTSLLPDGDLIGVPISPHMGQDPATFVRLDPAGNARWKTALGATQRLFISRTLVDGSELLVLGVVQGDPTFFAGGWQGTRDSMLGSTFLVRLDLRTGAVTGARWLFSQQRFESVEDMALDEQGNLMFALYAGPTRFIGRALRSPDGTQIWVVSANRTLDHVNWVRRFPIRAHLAHAHLHATRGAVLVAGLANGDISIGSRTIHGGWPDQGTFVAELGLDGRVQWAGGATLGRDYRPPALATDSAGNIYIAGKLDRDTSLGGHAVSPDGHGICGSIYLAKLARVRHR